MAKFIEELAIEFEALKSKGDEHERMIDDNKGAPGVEVEDLGRSEEAVKKYRIQRALVQDLFDAYKSSSVDNPNLSLEALEKEVLGFKTVQIGVIHFALLFKNKTIADNASRAGKNPFTQFSDTYLGTDIIAGYQQEQRETVDALCENQYDSIKHTREFGGYPLTESTFHPNLSTQIGDVRSRQMPFGSSAREDKQNTQSAELEDTNGGNSPVRDIKSESHMP